MEIIQKTIVNIKTKFHINENITKINIMNYILVEHFQQIRSYKNFTKFQHTYSRQEVFKYLSLQLTDFALI